MCSEGAVARVSKPSAVRQFEGQNRPAEDITSRFEGQNRPAEDITSRFLQAGHVFTPGVAARARLPPPRSPPIEEPPLYDDNVNALPPQPFSRLARRLGALAVVWATRATWNGWIGNG